MGAQLKPATLSDPRDTAEEIFERSESVAIRIADVFHGAWNTLFITKNVAAYGYNHKDFLSGKITWRDLIHPEDLPDLVDLLTTFGEMGNDKYNTVYRILRADGTTIWVSASSLVVRDDDGGILYIDCIVSDYTETKEHIERIGENFRQQAVLNEILQGLHDVDLDKAIQTILDRSGSYLGISRVTLFQNSPDNATCRAEQAWCNTGITSLMEQGEFVLNYENDIPDIAASLRADGHRIVNHGDVPKKSANEFDKENNLASAIFAISMQGEPFGFVAFEECVKPLHWTRDVIRFLDNVSRMVAPVIFRRRNEQLIHTMAMTDQLTGLYNRYCMEIRLDLAIAQAREVGQSGYVLFIDMDDFKIINDAYGHDYGDAILREVSGFLKTHFADPENIFRFGGDEFVIILSPDKVKDIYDIMGGLLQRAQLPWTVLDRTFYCTLSIGVVRFPEANEDGREIIRNADIAMYQAKKMGKNNYVFYTSTLDNDSVARAEMENAMREAIDNNFDGFDVYYQPLVDMDGKIIGVEALLRWLTFEGKRIAPATFIPLAEYLGLIVPIGEHVMRSAVRCCRRINRFHPDFFVSVNVSIRQFKQKEFMEHTLKLLAEEKVNLKNVVLEITEGMAVHDMQRMKMIIGELRKYGIGISMDDFGTGYSSLGNMRELPIDIVKIDRSFIHGVTTDPYSKSFIRFISDLVHSMGREICIEGVENANQLRYCRECGADYVQGYHLWHPMPEDEILELLGLNEEDDAPVARECQ